MTRIPENREEDRKDNKVPAMFAMSALGNLSNETRESLLRWLHQHDEDEPRAS